MFFNSLTFIYLFLFLSPNTYIYSQQYPFIGKIESTLSSTGSSLTHFYQQASTDIETTLGLKDFFRKIAKDISKGGSVGCRACKRGLVTFKRAYASSLFRPLVINAVLDICKRKGQPAEILETIDFNKKENAELKQLFCFALDNTCDYPEDLKPNTLEFPEKKRELEVKSEPIRDQKKLRVLQLSDLHIDHLYETGAEADCKAPICCQKYSRNKGEKIKRAASQWGDYNCDIPQRLFESMLKFITNDLTPIDVVLFTGDIPAHDVWNQSSITASQVERSTFDLLKKAFDHLSIPVIPAIGNHEQVPANLFPSTSVQDDYVNLYSELGSMWKDWLPKKALESLKAIGVYSMKPFPGLKVISLNTNMCYLLNFWLVSSLQKDNQDPNFILHWLIQELNEAENTGEMVYIIGHVPPAHPDCFPYWSDGFHQIVNRYSHLIKGQFYGHTHLDQFQLFYQSNQTKQENTAINIAYINPSVTTFKNINPGFRIYEVGATNYGIYDSLTYIWDLTTASEFEEPKWKLEYSARDFFLPRPYDNMELTPQWWHRVVNKLEAKPHRMELFHKVMYKQAHQDFQCKEKCRKNIICNLRASNASQACARTSPISRH
ncbi:sphingomyelin phosphodiesterase [Neoconidiobolus thromboides FSU 785]|nr:sphingomyelin phosphodiesterase [Neoconidiobolus thromboides FSU 785]